MSIFLVLLMLLVILVMLAVGYWRWHARAQAMAEVGLQAPRLERDYGFGTPLGYGFHPGHTWVTSEQGENMRVGLDSFAANALGKIDHIDVVSPNRWIRQGQKLMTIKSGPHTVDLLSPVEGVITAVNQEVMEDASLANHSPYKDGWVAKIKSPDFAINQKNLIPAGMVAAWMQNNVTRLNALVAQSNPGLAQDGGWPVSGILARVAPEIRQKIVAEFFLN